MPKSVTQLLKIDKRMFAKTGALDAILDVDTRLFIDPMLIRKTRAPELAKSVARIEKHFAEILALLKVSKKPDDIFWRNAEKLMHFPEVKGICIGYSRDGTAGSGMGSGLRERLMRSAHDIIGVGIQEPDIFELAGLFEEDIGPDRISDMVAGIIKEDLIAYSERIFIECGVLKPRIRPADPYDPPTNPFNAQPIILVPKDILRDLPLALDWEDVPIVAAQNEALRKEVNALIGSTWRSAALRAKKENVRKVLLQHPELLKKLIEDYRKKAAEEYDFNDDPAGQIIWHEASIAAVAEHPLTIKLAKEPSIDQLRDVVFLICRQFRELIETHGLWKLLYDRKGKPKREEAAQLLFFGVANAYCEANDVDISRESNGGRGPVDFKFSKGYELRVVVEVKLTSNKALVHGLKEQIVTYAKAEKAKRGIYLVVDNGGTSAKRLKDFHYIVNTNEAKTFEVVFVDATPKKSASKQG
jgi:hypothetical protein